MKALIINWLMSQGHKIDHKLKKKLIIGFGVVVSLVFIGGVFLTYIGYKTTTYLISKVPSQEQLSGISVEIQNQSQKLLNGAIPENCLSQIQAHVNLNVWLTQPIAHNAAKISEACFGSIKNKETNEIQSKAIDENYI